MNLPRHNEKFEKWKNQIVNICDPIHALTGTSAVSEGVLDVLSCSTFFLMSTNDGLNESMKQTCLAFSILELFNGGVCFASSASLYYEKVARSDTVLIVKVSTRIVRLFIDVGAFITRMISWLKFGVIYSPFMIKNLYHIIHALVLIERLYGVNDSDNVFNWIEPKRDDWEKMKISK